MMSGAANDFTGGLSGAGSRDGEVNVFMNKLKSYD